MFDSSFLSNKGTICNITDLQSAHDRQLPDVGGILEESVGRDINGMELITKIIPN